MTGFQKAAACVVACLLTGQQPATGFISTPAHRRTFAPTSDGVLPLPLTATPRATVTAEGHGAGGSCVCGGGG